MPDAVGVAPRRAALKLLDAVFRQGLPVEAALTRAVAGMTNPSDRGLAHAIAGAVLRYAGDLDNLIDSVTKKRLPDDAKARMVIRMALAQVLVLETPPHAALATSLPLLEGGPRKLAHGVVGSLLRQGATLPEDASLPDLFAVRWQSRWGDAVAASAAKAWSSPPPLDLSLKPGIDAEALARDLDGVSLLPGHVRLANRDVVGISGFDEGDWWVQDLAASLPARLLGPACGEVLDLCAAPGGKTMQLASAGWQVTAVDNSAHRFARLDQNLQRTGLEARLVEADLLNWAPPAPVDAILLDAPCSATGIFRRHPDVLHRVRPATISDAVATQAAMLRRAASWLKPGGTLVYAVCSLEPEEGERQIAQYLEEQASLALDPIRADELPAGLTPTAEGFVRTLPGDLVEQGGLDGFFIARFKQFGEGGAPPA